MIEPGQLRRRAGRGGLAAFALAGALGLTLGPIARVEAREVIMADSKDPVEAGLAEVRGMLRLNQIEPAMVKLRALQEAHPENARVLLFLGSRLAELGKLDEAMQLYLTNLPKVPEPGPVYVDLERLYRQAGDWDRALEVCLEYQTKLGDRGHWVENEIESLIRADKLGRAAIEKLEPAVRARPEDTNLQRVWVLALFSSGQTTRALQEAQASDRTREGRGDAVWRYAQMALEKGASQEAVQAIDLVLASNPPAQRRDEAMYLKAQSLRKLQQLDASLQAYDALLAASPGGKFARSARIEKAQILANELHRSEDAMAAYQDILQNLNRDRKEDARLAESLRLEMADAEIRREHPEQAAAIYTELADSLAPSAPEVQARALYELGEIQFYQGKLKESETTFYRLIDRHPKERWVNDALERILQIGENKDAGGAPLQALAQASYLRRLGQREKAASVVSMALEAHGDSRAADDLWLLRVRLLLDLGRATDAAAAADTLASTHPESPLSPRALLAVASVYAGDPRTEAAAQPLFERIMLEFPTSIEAPAARAALKEIKAEWDAQVPGVVERWG